MRAREQGHRDGLEAEVKRTHAGYTTGAQAVVRARPISWYTATVTSWCWEDGDDGHKQRATRMVYDAVEGWHAEPHWHWLDDVTWRIHGDE